MEVRTAEIFIDRTPIALQDIEANTAVIVNVWMEELRYKLDYWRFVRVVERHPIPMRYRQIYKGKG